MSDKELLEGKLGTVGSYDLAFKGGKLMASLKAGAAGVSGGLTLEVDGDALIDALCKAIPGQIDDALGQILKAALKVV